MGYRTNVGMGLEDRKTRTDRGAEGLGGRERMGRRKWRMGSMREGRGGRARGASKEKA